MDRAVTRIAAALLGGCAVVAACGGPAKEASQGAACFRASECQPGLVCIAQVCTNDLSSVNIHEDSGAAGGAVMMMPTGDASSGAAGAGGGGSGNAGGAGGGGGKGGSAGSGGMAGSGMAGSGMAGSGMAGSGNSNDASAD